MERFAIFSREQEHTQKESGSKNGDGTTDLVSYVEFQKNHRQVVQLMPQDQMHDSRQSILVITSGPIRRHCD